MFLAAAAALVVAVVSAALAAGDDRAVETPPAEDGEVPATGWYLPPDGWEITEVRTDFLDLGEGGACPCRSFVAAGQGAEPSALVVTETTGPGEPPEGEPVDVGGRTGTSMVPAGDLAGLVVSGGGRHLVLTGSRLGAEPLAELADAWLDRLEAGEDVVGPGLPVPDGMTAGSVLATVGQRSVHLLDVSVIEVATGRQAYYSMVPAGAWYQSLVIDAGSIAARNGRFEVLSTIGVTPFVALVGGPADVLVGPSFFAEDGDLTTTEDLRGFLGAMRQVSVRDWRDAIADAVVEPEVLAAETLFVPPLVDGPVGG
jgi:hypothetical protein